MTTNAQRLFQEALTLAAAEARLNPNDDEDWRTVLDEVQREVLSR